jgi:hypothetical protein
MGFRSQFARQQFCVAHVRFGSKADFEAPHSMSALPPKADITERRCHVRFVPILLQKAAITDASSLNARF